MARETSIADTKARLKAAEEELEIIQGSRPEAGSKCAASPKEAANSKRGRVASDDSSKLSDFPTEEVDKNIDEVTVKFI